MFQHLKFAVRYWSSLLPEGFTPPDKGPAWVDYSLHPASKLGLHNALLAVHDRREILEADGGYYDCAVFLVGDGRNEQLSPEMAEKLFAALPHGRIKWLEVHHADSSSGAATVHASIQLEAGGAQLPLFQHLHTPYDDQDEVPHRFDLDV